MVNINERTGNLIEALFAFWGKKRPVMQADQFYQKMATYGLVPDIKFIEDITNIIYFNRPRPIVTTATMN